MHSLKITDVRAIPGDSSFLIDDGKTAILYDSGFGFTGFSVAENIRQQLGTRPLDYIFLTHSHYDHALGSAYIKKMCPDAKVVAGSYAAKIFEKPTAKAVMRDLDKKFAITCGIEDYEDLTDNLSVDIIVDDGDIIVAGDMEFHIIALPGHTKCSIGYYLPSEKLLLSCETIGVYGGENIVVPSFLVSYEMTLRSISMVKELNPQNILVPHFGLLTGIFVFQYLNQAETSAKSTYEDISQILQNDGSHKDALDYFCNKFYHGYIKTVYPVDAMELNTDIMIKLIEKELICYICITHLIQLCITPLL